MMEPEAQALRFTPSTNLARASGSAILDLDCPAFCLHGILAGEPPTRPPAERSLPSERLSRARPCPGKLFTRPLRGALAIAAVSGPLLVHGTLAFNGVALLRALQLRPKGPIFVQGIPELDDSLLLDSFHQLHPTQACNSLGLQNAAAGCGLGRLEGEPLAASALDVEADHGRSVRHLGPALEPSLAVIWHIHARAVAREDLVAELLGFLLRHTVTHLVEAHGRDPGGDHLPVADGLERHRQVDLLVVQGDVKLHALLRGVELDKVLRLQCCPLVLLPPAHCLVVRQAILQAGD
mmetsp:Transcript_86319/g.272371  ORF Transcript_86319/g.272371 Transcript_86319/m.272371 type:complete len:294 (-) Transcript_86319:1412-2293(-)